MQIRQRRVSVALRLPLVDFATRFFCFPHTYLHTLLCCIMASAGRMRLFASEIHTRSSATKATYVCMCARGGSGQKSLRNVIVAVVPDCIN